MTSGTPSSQVTAGFLNTDWNPRDLPPGATTRNTVLRTADGAATPDRSTCPRGRAPTPWSASCTRANSWPATT